MTPAERCFGVGVSGYGHWFFHVPFANEPSGAWDAISQGIANGDLDGGIAIGHLMWARRRATAAISDWMRGDRSQGGSESRNIMLVCVSWGATNAVALSVWFAQRYGKKPRLFVMIEGVGRCGRPYPRSGIAELVNNYHVGERHWPTGMAVAGACNVDLQADLPSAGHQVNGFAAGRRKHIAGEWAGCARAIADIRAAHEAGGAG